MRVDFCIWNFLAASRCHDEDVHAWIVPKTENQWTFTKCQNCLTVHEKCKTKKICNTHIHNKKITSTTRIKHTSNEAQCKDIVMYKHQNASDFHHVPLYYHPLCKNVPEHFPQKCAEMRQVFPFSIILYGFFIYFFLLLSMDRYDFLFACCCCSIIMSKMFCKQENGATESEFKGEMEWDRKVKGPNVKRYSI